MRLDRAGVSPREETTEFNSVNHPIVVGLRDQRSPSSSRSVAGLSVHPDCGLRYPRITRCQRRRCSCEGVPCRPTSGPNSVTEWGSRPPLSATIRPWTLISTLSTRPCCIAACRPRETRPAESSAPSEHAEPDTSLAGLLRRQKGIDVVLNFRQDAGSPDWREWQFAGVDDLLSFSHTFVNLLCATLRSFLHVLLRRA